jgi:hypothetical protein
VYRRFGSLDIEPPGLPGLPPGGPRDETASFLDIDASMGRATSVLPPVARWRWFHLPRDTPLVDIGYQPRLDGVRSLDDAREVVRSGETDKRCESPVSGFVDADRYVRIFRWITPRSDRFVVGPIRTETVGPFEYSVGPFFVATRSGEHISSRDASASGGHTAFPCRISSTEDGTLFGQ